MRRLWLLPALLALAVAVPPSPAAAKKTTAKTAATTKTTASSNGKSTANHPVSYSGMVKGSPSGKTFTLAMRKKSVTVDASGAKVRVNGKFAKFEDAIK